MKLHIAVIDDSQHDIKMVTAMIQQYFEQSQSLSADVSGFEDAESFFKAYTQNLFQIVLIDICMDGMNGLELSQRLRVFDEDIVIIFMSTTTEFVFETFKVLPHGYLRKPFSSDEFVETMDRAVSEFIRFGKNITVRMPRCEKTINTESIVSAYSDNHNTVLKLHGGELRTISTYSETARLLLAIDGFVECNRGIIINSNYILSQNGGNVKMSDGTVYPVRRQDRKTISDIIIKNLSRKIKGGFIS